jgi:hypothetical protein
MMTSLGEFSHLDTDNRTPLKHKQLRRIGLLVMMLSATGFSFYFYVFFLSSWQPALSNRFVDSMRDNNYYLLLLPVLVPTFLSFAWINWLGMQFFKRN